MLVIRITMMLLVFYLLGSSIINIYKIMHVLHRPPAPDTALLPYTDSSLVGVVRSFDYELRMHRTDFQDLPKTNTITVIFGETRDKEHPHAVGECAMYEDDERIVRIDAGTWLKLDTYGKEQLMFHELGHCILDREHCSSVEGDGKPASVMYPSLIGHWYNENTRDEYLEELFHADARCK
jgi:hypothetical protein